MVGVAKRVAAPGCGPGVLIRHASSSLVPHPILKKENVMKASEARELSEKSLKTNLIEPVLEHVYMKIRNATGKGKFRIYHPFFGYKPGVDKNLQEVVFNKLREDGYKVINHPGTGNSYSDGPYDEIRW